jgi:D-sedoheptulose 7-phosphate isomerase
MMGQVMQKPTNTDALTVMMADVARHQKAVEAFFAEYASAWEALAQQIAAALLNGHKVLMCGNGGSACDAMHIAGEFVGRFVRERKGMAAIALSADAGIVTAVGNDYGFEQIFARQVEALGRAGDVLIAMSTSGGSPNVLAALEAAKAHSMTTILLTGEKGRGRVGVADALFVAADMDTARVQEVHMLALHLLAGRVEQLVMEAEGA